MLSNFHSTSFLVFSLFFSQSSHGNWADRSLSWNHHATLQTDRHHDSALSRPLLTDIWCSLTDSVGLPHHRSDSERQSNPNIWLNINYIPVVLISSMQSSSFLCQSCRVTSRLPPSVSSRHCFLLSAARRVNHGRYIYDSVSLPSPPSLVCVI